MAVALVSSVNDARRWAHGAWNRPFWFVSMKSSEQAASGTVIAAGRV